MAFSALTTLQLNATLMTWAETEQIALAIPSLTELESGYNNLKQLSSSSPTHNGNPAGSTMEVLNLDANELSDWAHICQTLAPYTKYRYLISLTAVFHLRIGTADWTVSSWHLTTCRSYKIQPAMMPYCQG